MNYNFGVSAKKMAVIDCVLYHIVKEDTLLDMVNHMEDDVGLVHQMPFTCDREGFPATLEKVKKNVY